MAAPQPIIQYDEGWNKLSAAITKLQQSFEGTFSGKLFSHSEYMPIYTLCYNMSTQRPPNNHASKLYQAHGECIVAYLETVTKVALQSQHNDFLLKELKRRWDNHLVMNKWLWKIFMYLDRYYVDQTNEPKLRDAGLDAFKRMFSEFTGSVVEAVIGVIDRDRDGEMVDRSLVQSAVSVFVALGRDNLNFYKEKFEAPIVAATRAYYTRKSQAWLSRDSTIEYLQKAEAALESERARSQAYLHHSSEDKVLHTAEGALLKQNQAALMDKEGSGLSFMLANDKRDDLGRLYRLFSRIDNGLVSIAEKVKAHFQECGLEIVRKREGALAASGKENPSDPTFVTALLELHNSAKKLVEAQFQSNSLFQKALQDAFELFINKEVASRHSTAELISAFCDRILKTGSARLSDAQVEELLDNIVQIFTYISDKDVFSDHYRRQLSKRLLNQRSASADAERSMISKLKIRCGAQFTGKMEGMLHDLSVGITLNKNFEAYKSKQDEKLPFEFNVQVLTTGYWPTYKPLRVALPASVLKCQEMFEAHYSVDTSHRKLSWVHSLGSAILRGRFKKGVKDLQVTTLQMIALLHFNTSTPQTFTALREAMDLDEEVCKRLLHSLSCGKYKVITKSPKGRSIATTDTFVANDGFACSYRKIRIPMASLEEAVNHKRVQHDRSIAIEAAAVRTMKARKRMSHQELVTEVITQLHFFRPNPKVIKRRIATLIDREYLERDPDEPNMYNYLA